MQSHYFFFDRDLSWLSFNERVLLEAKDSSVPLLERLNFLSIYSSNLDEFYRVRMPALWALQRLYEKQKVKKHTTRKHADIADQAIKIIHEQQERFGKILQLMIPQLEENGICLLYNKLLPQSIMPQLTHYFFTQVLSFIKLVWMNETTDFFPENNRLYLVVISEHSNEKEELLIVNIPTEHLSRFFVVEADDKKYVVFLEDIIKKHLALILHMEIKDCYCFKVTRDAELNLDDEYEEDIAEKIEKQIEKRDLGLATRFLHDPDMPEDTLSALTEKLGLGKAIIMKGGKYHNLKDLPAGIPNLSSLKYPAWPPIMHPVTNNFLLDDLLTQDVLLHTPYHSYDTVLRFFNEAAIHADVEHIYLTMYRVASNSQIINALLSAAHNGKKVTVLIELKARFDEANNLKWAKRLKKAGVRVLYTPKDLKVHAKLALVRRTKADHSFLTGLLATGNLNENTARFYTDHILLTSQQTLLLEVEKLFQSFEEKQRINLPFNYLLVAQYNLQEVFLKLIDREITHARQGLPARITLKLNNLEERVLISKLYDASRAGVKINLIVRGICCLVPGVVGMSDNITVKRIIDRYLEHGRIYVFHNRGDNEVYLGSADWMNRNIYRRIEVCFPVNDEKLRLEVLRLLDLQLHDNMKAVRLNEQMQNIVLNSEPFLNQSQRSIYDLVTRGVHTPEPAESIEV